MSNLINPYKITELYTKVSLMPNQLNNDLYINLKQNLIRNEMNKCNEYGYVSKIFKINKHNDGVIYPENLSGAVIYEISYSAEICMPIENKQIICQVDKINKKIITTRNGPILVVIKIEDINQNEFFMNNLDNLIHKKTKQIIVSGDYVKITINRMKFNKGDTDIYVLGYLFDIANDKEINEYYPKIENNLSVSDDEIITEQINDTEIEYDKDQEDIETNLDNIKVGESNYIDI